MRLLAKAWKYSLFVTLPVAILFLVWLSRTYTLYVAEGLQFSTPAQSALWNSGKLNFYYLVDNLQDAILGDRNEADVSLFVDNQALYELNKDLPYSALGGKSFKPAYMVYPGGNLEKVSLRYRGDSSNHWLFREKSYRIKTQKSKPYNGLRSFNLIVHETPELLGPHSAYILADTLGLMAPRSEFVVVSINDKTDGAKLLVEQVDETFLRRRSRMPGDIYSGDNVGNGRFWGLEQSLFVSSLNWDKDAANNHYALDSKVPLEAMIAGLLRDDVEMLDLEMFGRFAAFTDIARSKHHDESHNWKLSYDHYLERFTPIVWDSIGWLDQWVIDGSRSGISLATIMDTLYRNHDFLYERQKVLQTFFTHQQQHYLDRIDQEIRLVKEKIDGIDYFVDVFREVRSRDEVLQKISDFRQLMQNTLEEVKLATVGQPGDYTYALPEDGLRLRIAHMPVEEVRIQLSSGVSADNLRVRYRLDGQWLESDLASVTRTDGDTLIVEQRLFPNSHMEKLFPGTFMQSGSHSFSSGTFDLLIGSAAASAVRSVAVVPMGAGVELQPVSRSDEIAPVEFVGQKNIVPQRPIEAPLVFSGVKTVTEFQTIERDLVIEPGTRIQFASGAGLRLKGKLTAIGTEEAPIVFTSVAADSVWGAVVLKDEGSDGSVLQHCIFENGSGVKADLFEYTAMLSVHNVKGVEIRNSLFRNSRETDDMLHTVYSELLIDNSVFENSLSDAIDLDISTARILATRFVDSGNDAIDLMTSTAFLQDTRITGSGDKAISIGENSRLFVVDSEFINNAIGLESKDASQALVYNSVIGNNQLGLHAYQKNWQYGDGGSLIVSNSKVVGNATTARADKRSEIVLSHAVVDWLPEPDVPASVSVLDSSDSAGSIPAIGAELLNRHFPGEAAALAASRSNKH